MKEPLASFVSFCCLLLLSAYPQTIIRLRRWYLLSVTVFDYSCVSKCVCVCSKMCCCEECDSCRFHVLVYVEMSAYYPFPSFTLPEGCVRSSVCACACASNDVSVKNLDYLWTVGNFVFHATMNSIQLLKARKPSKAKQLKS